MADSPRYNDRANTTGYHHPQERNLLDLHYAMQYRNDGTPEIRVNSTFDGNVVITGNVNIPGNVSVYSSPDNPVHTHITEVGTSDVLTVPWMPVAGNVTVDSGNITVWQGTTPWTVSNSNVAIIGNISAITTLPAITGNVGVSGNISITQMPAISGNVSITQMPGVTGNVKVYGNINVDNFPSNVSITQMPAVTGNVHVYGNVDIDHMPNIGITGNIQGITTLPAVTGNVGVSGNVSITQMPAISGNVNISTMPGVTGNVHIYGNIGGSDQPITVNQGTTPWVTTGTTTITGNVALGQFPDSAITAFDEPLAIGITPVMQSDAVYGLDPDFWANTQLNGGTVSMTPNNVWQISSGTSTGGYARLYTTRYMRYQPGQGAIFRWTAGYTCTGNTKLATGVDNIPQVVGPIDQEDGYAFGYSGNSVDNKFGILHRRAGKPEIRTLTITTAPTGSQTANITLNGTSFLVPVTTSTSTAYTSAQIAAALRANVICNNTWYIDACDSTITFNYYSPGAKSGTYDFSSSGTGTLAAGTIAQTQAGVTPNDTWTYIDSWDNQSIQFDPSKLNVFGMDMRWLGAGRVRFFMEDPATARMVLVHTQKFAGTQLYPHVNNPTLRIAYRSGTTSGATPSSNVIVSGASVFTGIQGTITQSSMSQSYYNLDSTTRNKDVVYHLLSIQNPHVRNNRVNKSSLVIQSLTVSAQGNDPSLIYIIKNCRGTSDLIVFNPIPNSTPYYFAQYSTSEVTENLLLDSINNVATLGINSTADFDLLPYNFVLAPGETISVFISSTNAINRTGVSLTWRVD